METIDLAKNIKSTLKVGFYLFFLALSLFMGANPTYSSSLGCWDVDGASIFGFNGDEYEFIGAISNEFDSNSIANEFGAGNEFSSDSIMNEFGDYGSEFSSESAFNEFASNPPILLDDDLEFIGYLTTNEFKTPYINTFNAIACAKDSFTSSENDHEDILFEKKPNSDSAYTDSSRKTAELLDLLNRKCSVDYGEHSYYSAGACYCNAGYNWNETGTRCVKKIICPEKSSEINGLCICDDGHVSRNAKCITYAENCLLEYGDNTVGSKDGCSCKTGHEWNVTKTKCVKIIEQTPTKTNNAIEVSQISTDNQFKEGQNNDVPNADKTHVAQKVRASTEQKDDFPAKHNLDSTTTSQIRMEQLTDSSAGTEGENSRSFMDVLTSALVRLLGKLKFWK